MTLPAGVHVTPVAALTVAAVAATAFLAQAQPSIPSGAPDVREMLAFPFPENLVAAPTGARVAWTMNARGVRNVYVADGPEFAPRQLTTYTDDDGMELTKLQFSRDGASLVYVRGGNQGAVRQIDRAPSLSGMARRERVQVWAAAVAPGSSNFATVIADGDEPVIDPRGQLVAFVRDRALWIAPLAKVGPAEAVIVTGSSEAAAWSPTGKLLAFVSNRGDHSFIVVYDPSNRRVRYVAPSASRDSGPVWSPDGTHLAFVRQPAGTGKPRRPLDDVPAPWSIHVARVATDASAALTSREAWTSRDPFTDAVPRRPFAADLRWAADDRLVFVSHRDGWPHVYAIEPNHPERPPVLLTPGAMMVEQFTLTPDGRTIVYTANSGMAESDRERRHLFITSFAHPTPQPVTEGATLNWAPVVTGDQTFLVHVRAGAKDTPSLVARRLNDASGATPITITQPLPTTARLLNPEPVSFRAKDGTRVHGQLFSTGSPGRKPAVVYLHGGPARQMLLGWHPSHYYSAVYGVNQLLALRGFVVLSINYRLGIGYGDSFQNAPRGGARGASEYADVLAAATYLRDRDDVDAKRIGVWGGSYGGYLAGLALGRNSDLFAAGVILHAVQDRVAGPTPDQLAHAIVGDGATEADYREALRVAFAASPIAAVGTWRSPVLLIHGDDDRNVSFAETVELKRRLVDAGVTVEELVLPDEIHTFLTWRAWVNSADVLIEFLERHLKAKRR